MGWWGWKGGHAVAPSAGGHDVASETPTPQTQVEPHDKVIAKTPKPGEISKRRASVHPKVNLAAHLAAAKSNGKAPSVRRERRGETIDEEVVVCRGSEQPLI